MHQPAAGRAESASAAHHSHHGPRCRAASVPWKRRASTRQPSHCRAVPGPDSRAAEGEAPQRWAQTLRRRRRPRGPPPLRRARASGWEPTGAENSAAVPAGRSRGFVPGPPRTARLEASPTSPRRRALPRIAPGADGIANRDRTDGASTRSHRRCRSPERPRAARARNPPPNRNGKTDRVRGRAAPGRSRPRECRTQLRRRRDHESMIAFRVATSLSRRNSRSPVKSSQAMTPSAQMSARRSILAAAITSGGT